MRGSAKKRPAEASPAAHFSKHGRMKTLAAQVDPRVQEAEKYLLPTYKRQPFLLERGRGCYVYDADGKKYLDFLGGIAVNALGHAHPRIVKTIRREAARAIHFSNLYHNAYQGPLARKLAEWSGLDRVFFCNSGTEAIDGAMKLARLCGRDPQEAASRPPRKHHFLALENSFHGRTFGAISVTATE
jgi:acetylornithine/N-succinyldiaminopimelate aminotransferase